MYWIILNTKNTFVKSIIVLEQARLIENRTINV